MKQKIEKINIHKNIQKQNQNGKSKAKDINGGKICQSGLNVVVKSLKLWNLENKTQQYSCTDSLHTNDTKRLKIKLINELENNTRVDLIAIVMT